MSKEILKIKKRLDKIESDLRIREQKVSGFISTLFFIVLILWWVNLIVYIMAGIWKPIKLLFMSKKRKLTMRKYFIKNEFNELAYLFNRLDDP